MTKEEIKRFEEKKKYFYSRLSENGRQAYQMIYEAVCEERDQVKLPVKDKKEFLAVISAFNYDFPDIIMVDWSHYSYLLSEKILYIPYCFEKGKRRQEQERFDRLCRSIVQKLKKKYRSGFQMEAMLYGWLVRNVTYGVKEGESWRGQTAYEALIFQKAVCHGIAALFKTFADLAGIEETLIVSGWLSDGGGKITRENSGEHSWNIVKIHGQYAHLDATNDGVVFGEAKGSDKYPCGAWMNFTDEEAESRYLWDRSFFPACHSPEISYCALQGDVAKTSSELRKMIRKKISSGKNYFIIKLSREVKWREPRELTLGILHEESKGQSFSYLWNDALMVCTCHMKDRMLYS